MTRGIRVQLQLPELTNTVALGAAIGRRLLAGDLVLLSGDLGAGKTFLTKGIAAGMGITDTITSPTFVLARVHNGSLQGRPTTLVHVDAYRLGGAPELDDLDLDTDLARAVVVVEWGDGIAGQLAPDPLYVNLIRHPDDSRTATLTAAADRWRILLDEVATTT